MCKWAVYSCASDMTLKVVNPGALYGWGGGGVIVRESLPELFIKTWIKQNLIWFNFEIFKFANREGNPIKV